MPELSAEELKRIRDSMRKRNPDDPIKPSIIKSPFVLGDVYGKEPRIANLRYVNSIRKRYYVTNVVNNTVRDNCYPQRLALNSRLIHLGIPLIMEGIVIKDIDEEALGVKTAIKIPTGPDQITPIPGFESQIYEVAYVSNSDPTLTARSIGHRTKSQLMREIRRHILRKGDSIGEVKPRQWDMHDMRGVIVGTYYFFPILGSQSKKGSADE